MLSVMRVVEKCLKFVAFFLFGVMVMSASATGVDALRAQNKAAQFLNNRQGDVLLTTPRQLQLIHAEKSKVDPRLADYYVFNADDGGAFVIVAGDDRAVDVLAYGAHAIDMNDVPCNMQWMLDHYQEQMDFLRLHPNVAVAASSG